MAKRWICHNRHILGRTCRAARRGYADGWCAPCCARFDHECGKHPEPELGCEMCYPLTAPQRALLRKANARGGSVVLLRAENIPANRLERLGLGRRETPPFELNVFHINLRGVAAIHRGVG